MINETEIKATIQEVRVTDIDMSFGNMVGFIIKLAFAIIPAVIFIIFISFMCLALLGGLTK
jgi:hypothetical protein